MCGIAGILNLKLQPGLYAGPVINMTRRMRHRGPDDEGYLLVRENGDCLPCFGDDTPEAVIHSEKLGGCPINEQVSTSSILCLGHRRLSIVDLSPAGHQPMHCDTGRYWIVYNGEIYNFQGIAQELKKLGVSFRSKSDTEVLLKAYIQWGRDCLRRFNGDFAFAIWDNREKELFCARDRIGIKPFYYTVQDSQFIFASDIKTIIASGLYHPEPDSEGLFLAMIFGIAPRPITAFKDIKSLEPGHWLRITPFGKINKGCYWNIPVGVQNTSMTKEEAAEIVETELTRAVKRRLVADVPVGTFMSGGIDSTTISAIAAQHHPGIKAFTLGYQKDAPELDEVVQAEATAKMHPMHHIVERVDPDKVLKDLSVWIDGYEEPFYSLAANHVISSLVQRNGVTVVLNGLGGDELYAGYSYYRFARFWPVIKTLHPFLTPFAPLTGKRRAERLAELKYVATPDELHTFFFKKNEDFFVRNILKNTEFDSFNTIKRLRELYADDISFSDPVEAMSYMDLKNYVGNHHVHRVDQFSMLNSVEGRFPFLDHELIEASCRIPSKWKLNGKIQKYVLRKVAETLIHPSCLSMKKKGFGLPLKQWMKGPLRPLVNDKIRVLEKREMINPQFIRKCFDDYRSGQLAPTRLWHLVALELWFERFIDGNTALLNDTQIHGLER